MLIDAGLASPVLLHLQAHLLESSISWLHLVRPNEGIGGRKEALTGSSERDRRVKDGRSQGISLPSSVSLGWHV